VKYLLGKRERNITFIFLLFSAIISILVMVGWFFNIKFFKTFLVGTYETKFNAALLMFLFNILIYLKYCTFKDKNSQIKKKFILIFEIFLLILVIINLS